MLLYIYYIEYLRNKKYKNAHINIIVDRNI